MTYGIVARRRQAQDANATILPATGRNAVAVWSARQPCAAFPACIFARRAQQGARRDGRRLPRRPPMTPDEALAAARAWLRDARRVVALTGAGISTESGIPDFRGPQGVWTKNPEAEKMATLSHYVADRFGLNPSAHKVGKPTGRRLVHCRSRQTPRPPGR